MNIINHSLRVIHQVSAGLSSLQASLRPSLRRRYGLGSGCQTGLTGGIGNIGGMLGRMADRGRVLLPGWLLAGAMVLGLGLGLLPAVAQAQHQPYNPPTVTLERVDRASAPGNPSCAPEGAELRFRVTLHDSGRREGVSIRVTTGTTGSVALETPANTRQFTWREESRSYTGTIYDGNTEFVLRTRHDSNYTGGNTLGRLSVILPRPAASPYLPPPYQVGTPGRIELDICDAEAAPMLILNPVTVKETVSRIDGKVRLSRVSNLPVSFDFETIEGTATAPEHYWARNLAVTIPAGSRSWDLRVWVRDAVRLDVWDNPDRQFRMRLSNVRGATLPGGASTADILVTIEDDDDPLPRLRIAPIQHNREGVPVGEMPESRRPRFLVEVMHPNRDERYSVQGGALSFRYRVTEHNGKVLARGNHEATAHIFRSFSSAEISVDLDDDDIHECRPTPINVEILPGPGYVPFQYHHNVNAGFRVTDNDEAPIISLGTGRAIESAERVELPITLSRESACEVSFHMQTADGTAVAGQDYEALNWRAPIAPGHLRWSVQVPLTQATRDDLWDNPDERDFTVTLSDARNAHFSAVRRVGQEAGGPGGAHNTRLERDSSVTARGIILDDDDALPRVAIVCQTRGDSHFAERCQSSEQHDGNFLLRAFHPTRAERMQTRNLRVYYEVTTEGNVVSEGARGRHSVVLRNDLADSHLVINSIKDQIDEPRGRITVRIVPGHGYAPHQELHTATEYIADDDPPPTLTLGTGRASESSPHVDIPVTLSQPSDFDIRFYIATSDGTARAGRDYQTRSQSAVIPAGNRRYGVRVFLSDEVRQNYWDEPDRELSVTLSSPEHVSFPNGAATITATAIIEDDDPSRPEVFVYADDRNPTAEGRATVFRMEVRDTRDTSRNFLGNSEPNYIPWRTSVAEADVIFTDEDGNYLHPDQPRRITVRRNAHTKYVEFRANTVDDQTDEPNARVCAELVWVEGRAFIPQRDRRRACARVADNDFPPPISYPPSLNLSIAESSEDRITMTSQVGNRSGFDAGYDFEIRDGSAVMGRDFDRAEGRTGTLRIPAGQWRHELYLGTLSEARRTDSYHNADLSFTVVLSNPHAGVFRYATEASSVTLVVTITDDDEPLPLAQLSSRDEAISEGMPARFVLSFAGPAGEADYAPEEELNVQVQASGGFGVDAVPRLIGVPRGQATVTIELATVDNNVVEDDGAVQLTVLAGAGYQPHPEAARRVATVQVADNDKPRLSIAPVAATVAESASAGAVFEITSTVAPPAAVPVLLSVSETGDYLNGTPASQVMLAAGQTRVRYVVALDDDAVQEAAGAVAITLVPAAAYSVGSPATASVTLTDNDVPALSVVANAPRIEEGNAAVFTVLASLPSSAARAVPLTVAVTLGANYVATTLPTVVTIPAGAVEAQFSVGTTNNRADDEDGTITATLSSPAAGARYTVAAGANRAMVVVSDEGLPMLMVATTANNIAEGDNAVFTISRPTATNQDLTVGVQVTRSGVGVGGSGRVGSNGGEGRVGDSATGVVGPGQKLREGTTQTAEVVIPAGQRSVDYTVKTAADARSGSDSRLTLRLADGAYTVDPNTGRQVVAVMDTNRPVLTLRATAASVPEGRAAEFVITVAPVATRPLQVELLWEEVGDYFAMSPSGVLTIAREQASATFLRATIDDDAVGADGSSRATLLASPDDSYALGTPLTASVTIVNDDVEQVGQNQGPLPELAAATVQANVAEGTAAEFRVTATPAFGEDTRIALNMTATGTNINEADLVQGLLFTAGQTARVISVRTSDNPTHESAGEVSLTLLPDAGYTINSSSAAVQVAVADNDQVALTLAAGRQAAAEGDAIAFTVSAEVPPRIALPFEVAITQDGDFLPGTLPQYLTLAANASSVMFELQVQDNETYEADGGTITVALVAGDNYSIVANSGRVQVAISDNDEERHVTTTGTRINEAIMPHVGITAADLAATAIGSRVQNAFSGREVQGLAVSGTDPLAYLATQARSRQTPHHSPLRLRPQDLSFAFTTGRAPGTAEAAGASDTPLAGRLHSLDDTDDRTETGDTSGNTGQTSTGSTALPGRGGFTFWGQGFQHDMSMDDSAINFDGKMTGGIIGIDTTALAPGLLVGLSMSMANSDLTYREGTLTGQHNTELSGYHPYFGWQVNDKVHLWGSYGRDTGEVEVTLADLSSRYERDVELTSWALGGYGNLYAKTSAEGDVTRLGFIGNAVLSEMEEDGANGIAVDAGRLRLGVELSHDRALTVGRLDSSVAMSLRHDTGDALTGSGVELGGGLKLLMNRGLELEVAARSLLAHNDNMNEWGLSGSVAWHAGRAAGQGLSVSFRPQWGTTHSRDQQFWEAGGSLYNQQGPAARAAASYNLELAYGIPLSQATDRLLTLHSRNHRYAGDLTLALGFDLQVNQHLSAGYEAVQGGSPSGGLNGFNGLNGGLPTGLTGPNGLPAGLPAGLNAGLNSSPNGTLPTDLSQLLTLPGSSPTGFNQQGRGYQPAGLNYSQLLNQPLQQTSKTTHHAYLRYLRRF